MRRVGLIGVGLIAAQASAADTPDPREQRMIVLYDELCLHAFPDDGAVDAYMAAKGARPLTPEEVRITFNDDPGRGWLLDDQGVTIQVMLELPPYHACSVRWMSDAGFTDRVMYKAATDAFKATRPGFAPQEPYRANMQGLAISATSEQRRLPDGSTETLMKFEQHVSDPKRRAAGETRVGVRFVHQIIAPDAP